MPARAIHCHSLCELLVALLDGNSNCHGHANHGVVTCADQAHHLYVCGHGGGACELRVAVHTAEGIGHAVGSGACSHVIGMQGTAGAAAGGHGEVLLAVLLAPLLVGTCNGVLEARRVGGVTGDGNAHVLKSHDGHALGHAIGAVALDSRARTVGEGLLGDHVHLFGGGIELGLHIGEAVDAGDDVSGILAKTVQDHAKGLVTHLVGVEGDLDGTLSSRKGLVAREEAEAIGLLREQHCAEVAVAKTHLAVLGNRAGNAECLQADADGSSGVRGLGAALLDGDGGTYGVGPAGVLEGDVLDAAHDFAHVDAFVEADLLGFLAGADTVLSKNRKDLVDTTGIRFKKRHNLVLCLGVLYSWRGSMYLAASAKRP